MSELQRYGLEWKSDTDFIATPMDDGYWTPWHIAQVRLTTAQDDNEAMRARMAGLVEALELISDTDPDEGTAWFHEIADKALAAHRKQETSHD